MTGTTGGPRLAGTTLLKIARLLLNEHLISTVVQPTLSDLQREIADAGPSGRKRLRARWRGYCAFWTMMLVAPFASSSPAQDVGAVAFPDAVARLAVGSILVSTLAVAGPMLGAWVAVIAAVGTLFAILIHAWYARHPSDLPVPTEPQRRFPQINFSSTEVAGNIGGLIFVVGSVFIVATRPAVSDLVSVRCDGHRMCSRVGARHLAYEPSEARPAGEPDRFALTGCQPPMRA